MRASHLAAFQGCRNHGHFVALISTICKFEKRVTSNLCPQKILAVYIQYVLKKTTILRLLRRFRYQDSPTHSYADTRGLNHVTKVKKLQRWRKEKAGTSYRISKNSHACMDDANFTSTMHAKNKSQKIIDYCRSRLVHLLDYNYH